MENIEALTEIVQRKQPTLAAVRRQCLHLCELGGDSSARTAWGCVAEICHAVEQYANAPDDGEGFDWTPFYYDVQYRSAWSSDFTGWDISDSGVECEILLAGGGPTVRLYCELDGYSGSGQYRVDHSHACATQSLDLREGMRESATGSSLENYGILCDAFELYILNVASYVQEY